MNDGSGASASFLGEAPQRRAGSAFLGGRRPIAVVVGAEHDCLCACAYALSLLGVDMADSNGSRTGRPAHTSFVQADWQRPAIRQLHERILALFGRDVSGPLGNFALPVAWWADPRVVAIRRELSAFVGDQLAGGFFGFADPATMRLLPIWRQIFAELRLRPKIVLCVRNPALVARLLHDNQGLDPDLVEYSWFVHMTDFVRYATKLEYCVIEDEAWHEDPSENFSRLQNFLGIEWRQGEADRNLALSGIPLRTGSVGRMPDREVRKPIVRAFYNLARRSAEEPEKRRKAEEISVQFFAFQQLQWPLENSAGIAEMARERDRHAAQCDELGAELAAARAGLAENESALTQARTALDLARAEYAERERVTEALQSQLNDAKAALAVAETERDSAASALAKSEEARNALRALLRITSNESEKAQNAANEQATSLEAAMQALQAQLVERERAIASVEVRVSNAEGALAAACSAREELTAQLGAAQQDLAAARQTNQAAEDAARSFETETAELRGALDACRQVWRAAVAGSTDDAARGVNPVGWLENGSRPIAVTIGGPLALARQAWDLRWWPRRESIITRADRAVTVGQNATAERLYRAALGRNPSKPAIWVQYGHVLKAGGKLTEAVSAYRRAIALTPDDADRHLQLGHALKLQGRTKDAVAAYVRAFACDPSLADPLAELRELGWSALQLAELSNLAGDPASPLDRTRELSPA